MKRAIELEAEVAGMTGTFLRVDQPDPVLEVHLTAAAFDRIRQTPLGCFSVNPENGAVRYEFRGRVELALAPASAAAVARQPLPAGTLLRGDGVFEFEGLISVFFP